MHDLALTLAAAMAALAAVPAAAQTSATHAPVAGAVSGRSPHVALREIARAPSSCGRTVYLQGGRMPTYGDPAAHERCRRQELARNDAPKTVHED